MRQKWRLLKSWKGSKTRNGKGSEAGVMSGAKNRTWLKVFKGVVGVSKSRPTAANGNSLYPSSCKGRHGGKGQGIILWTDLTREATNTWCIGNSSQWGKV